MNAIPSSPRRSRPTADDGQLTPEEVNALAGRIEAGLLARASREAGDGRLGGSPDGTEAELRALELEGAAAHQRLFGANLGLIAMTVRPYVDRAPGGVADLFQEGCLGLLTAIERFDHHRGVRFSTYALFWVRAFVNAAATQQLGAAHLSTSRAIQLRGARGLEAVVSQELGRPATVAELAEALGRSTAWTAELLAHQPPASLHELDEHALTRWHHSDATEAVLHGRFRVEDLLARLDPRSRRVLILRLGLDGEEPQSFASVARVMQMSATHVRRIETAALERLRDVCPQEASMHLRSA